MRISLFSNVTRIIANFLAQHTTANCVTVVRCAATLLVIPLWIFGGWNMRFLVLCVWGVCWYMDAVDGVMAREEGQESKTGKWLDPLADKIQFYSTMFLFWSDCDPRALGGLFVADGYSTIKRGCGKKTIVVGANSFGKWKTVFQIAAFFSFAIAELFVSSFFVVVANVLLYSALGFAIASIMKRIKFKSP